MRACAWPRPVRSSRPDRSPGLRMEIMTTEIVRTICGMCGADNCGIDARLEDGVITGITGSRGNAVNRGMLCPQAKASIEMTYDPARLNHPLRKTAAGWQPHLVGRRARRDRRPAGEAEGHRGRPGPGRVPGTRAAAVHQDGLAPALPEPVRFTEPGPQRPHVLVSIRDQRDPHLRGAPPSTASNRRRSTAFCSGGRTRPPATSRSSGATCWRPNGGAAR